MTCCTAHQGINPQAACTAVGKLHACTNCARHPPLRVCGFACAVAAMICAAAAEADSALAAHDRAAAARRKEQGRIAVRRPQYLLPLSQMIA